MPEEGNDHHLAQLLGAALNHFDHFLKVPNNKLVNKKLVSNLPFPSFFTLYVQLSFLDESKELADPKNSMIY
jgi:hypothetical protein